MSRSILDTKKCVCFMCGRFGPTEKHHIFGGVANRKLSEQDGLYVYLCPDCHNRPPNGVHFNKKNMRWLHRLGQTAYELTRCDLTAEDARSSFMERYGKNYLWERKNVAETANTTQ